MKEKLPESEAEQKDYIDEIDKAESEVAATTLESPEVEGILKKLDPADRELISATISSYSGPLPPPDYLKGYMEVYPNAAEMIFGWANQEQVHRQKMDELHLNNSFKTNKRGINLGFFLMLTFIVGGILLIFLDKEIYGLTLMVPVIGTALGLLFRQKRRKRANSDDAED